MKVFCRWPSGSSFKGLILLLEMGNSPQAAAILSEAAGLSPRLAHRAFLHLLGLTSKTQLQQEGEPDSYQDERETKPASHTTPSFHPAHVLHASGLVGAAGGMCDFWHQESGTHLVYLDVVPPLGGSPKVSVAFHFRFFLRSTPYSPCQACHASAWSKTALRIY